MNRWWLTMLLLISVGLNIGLFASRAFRKPAAANTTEERPIDGAREEEDRLPRVVYRMARELGLQGAKRDAFIAIQRGFFEQTLAARGRMATIQHEVRREITSDEPDREALDDLLIELSAAHTDLERAFVNNLLDSRELLNAKQEQHFMRFLRRMRQVRSDVERRFRERWRKMPELGRHQDNRQRRRPALRPRQPPTETVEPETQPEDSRSKDVGSSP